MKDYYAILRIQHGRLKSAMQELGIRTVAELACRAGTAQGTIGCILNFRVSPRAKNGKWRPVTLAICKVFGLEPSELFPEHLDHEVPTNCIANFVDRAQLEGDLALQLGPAEECQKLEMEQRVDEVLGTLSDIERNVLKSRFWEDKTFDEIASEHNRTRSGIGLIEQRALRKLRHPERIKKLTDVCMGFVPTCSSMYEF